MLTMPLLEGLDGVEKMSKSKGNTVGIAESPDEMFGKLMSISDSLMWKYFTCCPSVRCRRSRPCKNRRRLAATPRHQGGAGPRDRHPFPFAAGCRAGLANFESRFKQGEIPTDLPVVEVGVGPLGILAVLKQAGLAPSTSEAGRNLEQVGFASMAKKSWTEVFSWLRRVCRPGG